MTAVAWYAEAMATGTPKFTVSAPSVTCALTAAIDPQTSQGAWPSRKAPPYSGDALRESVSYAQ